MPKCKNCNTFFRDNYDLLRHESRVKPCVKNILILDKAENPNNTLENPNNTLENPNNTLENPNNTLENPNNTFNTSLNTCKHCLNCFSTQSNKCKHEKICKLKDDPIRVLETENGIIPELPENNTECRFCNKTFCRKGVLNKHIPNCKEREVYHQILVKEKQQYITNNNNNNVTTINNNKNSHNTNCNNTTNNNLILNFGQENLNHLQTENIIKLLRDIRKEFGNDQIYLMAGNLISSFDNYIRENPENKNLIIPDSKCLYAETKIEGGWEKMSIDRSLNKAFKNSAKELYTRKEEIDSSNDRVFNSNRNKEIFTEVKHFSNKGFNHYHSQEDLRQIKTEFKISKLKNKKTNDDEIDF
jgi:hypothetical protein